MTECATPLRHMPSWCGAKLNIETVYLFNFYLPYLQGVSHSQLEGVP